eukprot:g26302.t1
MPKYDQLISCPTRGPNILHHCYTTIKDAYRSIPRSHLGKSDHSAVFLLPAYKQKLKREDPSQKEIQCWFKAAEEYLQDCSESVDWTVFEYSAENLDEYATTVTDVIYKCMVNCVPKKPWMNREVHCLLKTQYAEFKLDDPDLYRKSRYNLHKAIRDVKRQYQT